MNDDLIKKITKLIIEKIQSEEGTVQQSIGEKQEKSSVTLWDHTKSSKPKSRTDSFAFENSENIEDPILQGLIQLKPYSESVGSNGPVNPVSVEEISHKAKVVGVDNPKNPEELRELVEKTPARIGIGRAGLRSKTKDWLRFRYDHAAAVDAVYGTVKEEVLKSLELFKVNTMVVDKEVYIRRPDYGRKLSEDAKKIIREKCKKNPTVQIVISDGLSSSAVEENVEDVYLSLQQSLKSLEIDVGTPFYIEQGRVAVMDDVGEILQPQVAVLLIGERPGLMSAESLSAYLCYQPRKGTIEADRMVISNIHKGGIPPVEAGAYIGTVIQKILKYEASGVSLVQKES